MSAAARGYPLASEQPGWGPVTQPEKDDPLAPQPAQSPVQAPWGGQPQQWNGQPAQWGGQQAPYGAPSYPSFAQHTNVNINLTTPAPVIITPPDTGHSLIVRALRYICIGW